MLFCSLFFRDCKNKNNDWDNVSNNYHSPIDVNNKNSFVQTDRILNQRTMYNNFDNSTKISNNLENYQIFQNRFHQEEKTLLIYNFIDVFAMNAHLKRLLKYQKEKCKKKEKDQRENKKNKHGKEKHFKSEEITLSELLLFQIQKNKEESMTFKTGILTISTS